MSDIDNRPQLPDIIPEGEVAVTGEEHRYEVFETDSGTAEQFEYTLDKAPANEIISASGLDRSGESRTFNNGSDYILADMVRERKNSFTFSERTPRYEVSVEPDENTIVVTDENGVTYNRGVDYQLVNPDGAAKDTIKFDSDENNPSPGVDFEAEYTATFPDSVIQWQSDADNLPQPGRPFFVEYRAPSVIGRYLDTSEDKLDSVEDNIRQAIDNKFVTRAEGDALDELGKLFGPVIGNRRGRSDQQYRIYLRSVVKSFISRGTVNGIKLAISAATDVPIEDITIDEDFQNNSYQVIVVAETAIKGSVLEEIAEIADPSGVNQERTRFTVGIDTLGSDDEVLGLSENRSASDSLSSDDSVAAPTVESVAFWNATGVNFNDGDEWAGENN